MASLRRGARLPGQLLREYRLARSLPRNLPRSAFDTEHGVDTDGELGGWTYLSDLEIASPNWIHGVNYTAVEPERFAAVMSGMAKGYTLLLPLPGGEREKRTIKPAR